MKSLILLLLSLATVIFATQYNLSITKDVQSTNIGVLTNCFSRSDSTTGEISSCLIVNGFVMKRWRSFYLAVDLSSIPNSATVSSATLRYFTTSSSYNGKIWNAALTTTGTTTWSESTFCPNDVTIGSSLGSGNVASQEITVTIPASTIQSLLTGDDMVGVRLLSNLTEPYLFDCNHNLINVYTSESSTSPPVLEVVTN